MRDENKRQILKVDYNLQLNNEGRKNLLFLDVQA